MPPEPDFRYGNQQPWFDFRINLGHILTAIMMACGLVTMWVHNNETAIRHESRIEYNEKSIAELQLTMHNISESQQQMTRTQDKLTLTLEYLAKSQSQKP